MLQSSIVVPAHGAAYGFVAAAAVGPGAYPTVMPTMFTNPP